MAVGYDVYFLWLYIWCQIWPYFGVPFKSNAIISHWQWQGSCTAACKWTWQFFVSRGHAMMCTFGNCTVIGFGFWSRGHRWNCYLFQGNHSTLWYCIVCRYIMASWNILNHFVHIKIHWWITSQWELWILVEATAVRSAGTTRYYWAVAAGVPFSLVTVIKELKTCCDVLIFTEFRI